MFSILQNAVGAPVSLLEISDSTHSAYAKKYGYQFLSTRHDPPPDYIATWSKILCILNWLDSAADGDVAVWIDADGLIVKDEPLDGVLPDQYDLGLLLIETRNAEFYNCGVMFIRKSEKVKAFFWVALAAGPFKIQSDGYIGCPYLGDQGRINSMLKESGLNIFEMDCRYNSYMLKRSLDPVIMAWHGVGADEAAKGMRAALKV